MSVLSGGQWVQRGGIHVWDDTPAAAEVRALRPAPTLRPFDPDLIACPTCRATVTQTCRTTGGNPTAHTERLVSRRCPCGAVLQPKKAYCEPCRTEARRRTYRLREIRRPTVTRRAS